MTIPAQTIPALADPIDGFEPPDGWREMRSDESIQFNDIAIPRPEPQDPTWFTRLIEWLAELIRPIGGLLAEGWPIIRWVLLALVVAFVLMLVWRMIGPRSAKKVSDSSVTAEATDWQPTQAETEALLGDADRLAAEGRYDEATHLLLIRSVNQIAGAKPDWVVPSSTARELAALPDLSHPARRAFETISERVERSMFALRALGHDDWEVARKAYADFALARIDGSGASI